MKNSIISTAIILIGFALHLQAQQTETIAINTGIYATQLETGFQNALSIKRQAPEFPVEMKAARFEGLQSYVAAYLSYPRSARENNIEGIVKVLVQLSPEGKVLDAQIVKSLGYGCDEAALDMALNMPRWQPAMCNGAPIPAEIVVPVAFRLTL